MFFFVILLLLLSGAVFLLPRTHANSDMSANVIPSQRTGLLLDSSFDGHNATIESVKLSADAPQVVSDFGNSKFSVGDKRLYLSPDRKLIAVMVVPLEESSPLTYIAKIDGTQLTPAYPGRFESWAPDSSKVLLYLSPMEAPWMRKIYALDTKGNYYDLGLPNGTISADISPADGSIAYSLTTGGTDNSAIYIRDPKGNEKLILKGDRNILAGLRWFPKGDELAIMLADLLAEHSEIWTVNPDGSELAKVSDIAWNYPPVWSPDGTRIAFSNAGDIWEYNILGKSLHNATNLSQGGAQHPNYSADGKTLVFSSNGQLWKSENGVATQLMNDIQPRDYPILP